ncbi:MAG: molybdenum cofactor biosysynthesis protein [Chthoniobacteraceae bacterium]|nr:molybdenum cofactor biosysynthesis protein [Chthoniobacteraceae bacterium]
MKLLSLSVSQPREVEINGRLVLTGIYKEPVSGSVHLGPLNLEGDGQADLTVHGGKDQAVYAYPVEHYEFWQHQLGREPFAHGMFGENLTASGLLETEVCIGDSFKIGTAVLQVTMPRLPCFKFAHKIGRPILKEFLHSGRSGFYLRVLKEGILQAGDAIEEVACDPIRISVRTMLGLQRLGEGGEQLVREALKIESLCPVLRVELERRLQSF